MENKELFRGDFLCFSSDFLWPLPGRADYGGSKLTGERSSEVFLFLMKMAI